MSKHTTAYVRLCLNKILLTDSDLEAFCIDHFPQALERFTNGMDRIAKVNLLLKIEPNHDKIIDKLASAHPVEFRALPIAPPPSASPSKYSTKVRLVASLVFGLAIIASVVIMFHSAKHQALPARLIDASSTDPSKAADLISSVEDPCAKPNICLYGTDPMGKDATYKTLRIDAFALGDSWEFGSATNIYYKAQRLNLSITLVRMKMVSCNLLRKPSMV